MEEAHWGTIGDVFLDTRNKGRDFVHTHIKLGEKMEVGGALHTCM